MTVAPQCTQMLESHGRPWRCTRPAARKHDYKLCGHCAALAVKRCGRGGEFVYHEAECAGCTVACCADRALCGPNCFEGRTADGRPLPAKKLKGLITMNAITRINGQGQTVSEVPGQPGRTITGRPTERVEIAEFDIFATIPGAYRDGEDEI